MNIETDTITRTPSNGADLKLSTQTGHINDLSKYTAEIIKQISRHDKGARILLEDERKKPILKINIYKALLRGFEIEDDFFLVRKEWEDFIRIFGDLTIGLANVRPPDKTGTTNGFDRLIFMPKYLTYRQLIKEHRKHDIKVVVSIPHNDLDVATFRRDERNSKEAYALWVEDNPEADEGNTRRSWQKLFEAEDIGITLKERLFFGLKYFLEKGQHLDDNDTATLCSGTTFPGGCVPYVYFDKKTNALVIKQCLKEFFGKDNHWRCVRSRSVIAD